MTPILNQLGGELFALFGPLSVELAVLALLVLLAVHVLRIESPVVRHLLWLAVLLKPVVALTVSSPWTVFTPLMGFVESGWLAAGHAAGALSVAASGATPTAAPVIDGSMSQLTFSGWVAALWMSGGALLLCRIVIGHGVILRLRRRAQIQRSGPLYDALQKARLALDVDREADVATSSAVRSSIVAGLLRPLIVIPSDLAEKLRPDELEMVLMHELAHVRRYDNLALLTQRLIGVPLFFHPAVWLCGRMLRREAEQACDDLVVNATGRSEAYARGLTSLAELIHLKDHLMRRIPIMSVSSVSESDLALRIRRTLAGRVRRMSRRSRVLAALLICGACAVTLPSVGVAGSDAEIDWETVKTTAPEDWSEELKDQLVAAGHDLETLAERVRLGQRTAREEVPDLDAVGRRLRAAVERGDMTPEEGRERYSEARARAAAGDTAELDDEFRRGVLLRAMATPVDDWSDRLKAAIERAGWDLAEFTEGIRLRQERIIAEGHDLATFVRRMAAEQRERDGEAGRDAEEEFRRGVAERAMASPPEEWNDRLKAAIERAGWDLAEFTEAIRLRQAHAASREDDRDGDARLREFQRGVAERAMASPPEEWSDEMKAAIERAGWDVEALAERVSQARDGGGESLDLSDLSLKTAIQAQSWGQVKAEIADAE